MIAFLVKLSMRISLLFHISPYGKYNTNGENIVKLLIINMLYDNYARSQNLQIIRQIQPERFLPSGALNLNRTHSRESAKSDRADSQTTTQSPQTPPPQLTRPPPTRTKKKKNMMMMMNNDPEHHCACFVVVIKMVVKRTPRYVNEPSQQGVANQRA